jgi:hypothetical protein
VPVLPDFSWCNIPRLGKYTKWQHNIPKGLKIDPMAVKYTIFHCKTLQNLPKSRFWVWKYTIWQPCRVRLRFPGFRIFRIHVYEKSFAFFPVIPIICTFGGPIQFVFNVFIKASIHM